MESLRKVWVARVSSQVVAGQVGWRPPEAGEVEVECSALILCISVAGEWEVSSSGGVGGGSQAETVRAQGEAWLPWLKDLESQIF